MFQAANLVEARRLKKEARKRRKDLSKPFIAEHTQKAAPRPVKTTTAQVPLTQQEQLEGAQTTESPVTRAVERWGSLLSGDVMKERNVTSSFSAFGDAPLMGSGNGDITEDTADGDAVSEPPTPLSDHLYAETAADQVTGIEHHTGEIRRATDNNSLSPSLAAAVNRAAGALPLSGLAYAEALISDLLPAPSLIFSRAEGRSKRHGVNGEESTSGVFSNGKTTEGDEQVLSTRGDLPSPPQSVCITVKPNISDWTSSVYHEVRFGRSHDVAADSHAGMESKKSRIFTLKGCDDWDPSLRPPRSVLSSAVPPLGPNHAQESLQECKKNSITTTVEHHDSHHLKPAGKRLLDLLHDSDWRTRRLSRIAAEIDMGLCRDEEAEISVSSPHFAPIDSDNRRHTAAHLRLPQGNPTKATATEKRPHAFPDLGAVVSAQEQQQECRKQHNASMSERIWSRQWQPKGRLGAAAVLDSESLAAEALGQSTAQLKGRTEYPPDPSHYKGIYELDMHRCYNKKWRCELVPVGAFVLLILSEVPPALFLRAVVTARGYCSRISVVADYSRVCWCLQISQETLLNMKN